MQRAFFNENKWVWVSCDFFCAQPITATSKKYRLNIQPTTVMISYLYCSIIPIQYQQNGFSRKSINPVYRFGIQDSATACWSRCCCIFPEGWVFAARNSIKPMIFVWYKPNDVTTIFRRKSLIFFTKWMPDFYLKVGLQWFIINSFCPTWLLIPGVMKFFQKKLSK